MVKNMGYAAKVKRVLRNPRQKKKLMKKRGAWLNEDQGRRSADILDAPKECASTLFVIPFNEDGSQNERAAVAFACGKIRIIA